MAHQQSIYKHLRNSLFSKIPICQVESEDRRQVVLISSWKNTSSYKFFCWEKWDNVGSLSLTYGYFLIFIHMINIRKIQIIQLFSKIYIPFRKRKPIIKISSFLCLYSWRDLYNWRGQPIIMGKIPLKFFYKHFAVQIINKKKNAQNLKNKGKKKRKRKSQRRPFCS